jgi:hypothetical protein
VNCNHAVLDACFVFIPIFALVDDRLESFAGRSAIPVKIGGFLKQQGHTGDRVACEYSASSVSTR